MLPWIQNTMTTLGYPGIVFLMFLENVFPPIPSELIMPFAGFTAAQGQLTFYGVVLAGWFGSLVGQLPLYYLGRLANEDRLKGWADRYGRWFGVSGRDIGKADDWFDRHGPKAVFLGRLVPGVRSLISVPAGMSEMKLAPFLLYSALGTGLWSLLLAWLGLMLGQRYDLVETYLGPVSYVVFAGLLVVTLAWLVKRARRR